MIKANELRKNNLVLREGKIVPVGWNALGFDIVPDDPIPLTPEIIQDGLNLIDSPELRDSISDLTKGKKLHQFQNLIFDLTGQELEFKQQPAIIHSRS